MIFSFHACWLHYTSTLFIWLFIVVFFPGLFSANSSVQKCLMVTFDVRQAAISLCHSFINKFFMLRGKHSRHHLSLDCGISRGKKKNQSRI